jgi:hypothetical protein
VQNDTIRRLKIADAKIEGRIDAIENGKVYGWAWDRLRPDDRLRVEIRLGERCLGTGMADEKRDDLAANGIGDGAYAFALVLDETSTPEDMAALVVVAMSPSADASVTLRPRLDVGMPAENALARPVGRIAELLETALGADRQILMGQQALARELRALTAQTEPGGAAAQLAMRQEAIAGQIEALEVFTVRLDGTLADLNAKLARFERSRGTELGLRRMVWIVGTLALASLIASGFALAGL